MKIINDGLPEQVYLWILKIQGEYSKGEAEVSVTQLINPPGQRVLYNKYSNEVEVKASTLLAATIGNTIHDAIEDATYHGQSERRLFAEVLGWRISGGMDHYHDGVLMDYKTCNVVKVIYKTCPEGSVDEWERQLNCYAFILRANGIEINKLKIWAWFKDWNQWTMKAAESKGDIFEPNVRGGYPHAAQMAFDINLWDEKRTEEYVHTRVKMHQEAEKGLIFCPKDELWEGRRCEQYCNVRDKCEQYKTRYIDPFKIRRRLNGGN